MDYRDDRDALRARADSLESDLATARAENDRLRQVEITLAASERENAKLRADLRRLAPKPKRPSGLTVATLAIVGLSICAGGAAFLLVRRPAELPPSDRAESPTPANLVAPPSPAAEPQTSARSATVEWPARVLRATGLPYAAGAPCVVRATLRSNGSKVQAPEVEIACSGKSLYRSSDQLNGTSSMSYGIDEAPGVEEGTFRASLVYEDQGTRTGQRTQASLSSPDRVAVAWKDTAPAFKVELEIEELSTAWKGWALFVRNDEARPAFRQEVVRSGHATEVHDMALVPQGTACTVRIRPAFAEAPSNCRVAVRCGEATIYGGEGGGFAACTAEGGRVFSAEDGRTSNEDKDPAIALSLPRNTVEVRDSAPTAWSVKVTLDK